VRCSTSSRLPDEPCRLALALDRIIYPHSYPDFAASGKTDADLMDILRKVHLSYLPAREGGELCSSLFLSLFKRRLTSVRLLQVTTCARSGRTFSLVARSRGCVDVTRSTDAASLTFESARRWAWLASSTTCPSTASSTSARRPSRPTSRARCTSTPRISASVRRAQSGFPASRSTAH